MLFRPFLSSLGKKVIEDISDRLSLLLVYGRLGAVFKCFGQLRPLNVEDADVFRSTVLLQACDFLFMLWLVRVFRIENNIATAGIFVLSNSLSLSFVILVNIAVLAFALGVGQSVFVKAVSGLASSSESVITVVTHALGEMLLVRMRAAVDPARLASRLALDLNPVFIHFIFIALNMVDVSIHFLNFGSPSALLRF